MKKPKDVTEELKTAPPVPSASVTPADKERENEHRRSLVEADLDSNRYSYHSDQDGSTLSDKDSDINKSAELNSDLEIEQTVIEPVIGTPNDSENAKDKGSENTDKSESDPLFISAYSDHPASGVDTPDECEHPEEFSVAVENVHLRPPASTTDIDADKESAANTPVTTSAAAEALGIANVDLIPSLEKSDILSSPEDQGSGASSVVCVDEGGGGTMGGEASHEVQESRVETAHQPDVVVAGNHSLHEPAESAPIDVAGSASETDTKDSLDGFTLLDPSPMEAAPATEDKRPSTFESPLQHILTTVEPATSQLYPQLFQAGRIKALTAEQLRSLYYNPILEGLDRVVNDFLEVRAGWWSGKQCTIFSLLGLFSIYGWARSQPMREDVT